MKPSIRAEYRRYIELAKSQISRCELDGAFQSLEMAHVLGQRDTLAHTRSHLMMLKVGYLKGDYREVLGQITRSIAALLFSKIWVPRGNTGGSNVNPFKPMPIPSELKKIMGDRS